ncbi:MAG TPA: hypothetical protein VGD81_01315 [Opitutaceae bacterium]
MKKLLVFLGVIVALVVVALLVATFFLGGIVKKGVNTVGPRITLTKVELEGARISPLSGEGTLSGLLVGNPQGWTSDRAFYLGKVHVDVEPGSLLGDHIVVNEVIIEQPQFVYETKIVSSNIKDLLNNIEKSTGSGQKPVAETKEGAPLKFEVKTFRLSGGQVTLGVGPAAITVPMPPVSLDNLGTKEGGITADQLAGAIMRNVLASIVSAAADAAKKVGGTLGATATDAASGAAQKAADSLKGLFNKKEEKEAQPAPKP